MPLLRELTVAVLLLLGCANASFYSKKSSVTQLTHKNFDQEILNSKNAAVVEFYAPWCGHCQNLKPAYDKLADSLKGIATVAAIDCDEEKNKRTCGEYGVQGFPTLKIFKPSGKKGKPIVEDYQGPRTAKAIADALVEHIPNHVTKITAPKFDNFLSTKNETTKAILFTNKGTTGALWKSLAIDFLDVISFVQIRDKEKEAVEKLGVTKFPTIVLLPGGDAKAKVYEGKMEKQALFDFFAAVKPPKAKEATSEKPKASKSETSNESSSSTSAEAEVTEKSKPEIPSLPTLAELQASCLAKKSKTCIIALADAPLVKLTELYGKLESRPPPHTFQVFKVDATGALAKKLVSSLALGTELPQLLAVNYRGWYRRYSGDVSRSGDVLAWLDGIKMGEGKKEKIPEALTAEEAVKEDGKKMEDVKDEL